jgi:hypothetical protein
MKIFISIASYEDPELVDTIKSAIENASSPENLIFGLCLQYEDEPDLSFLNKKQKRIISFDHDERPGLVRARFLIKKMFLKEDYFLQIDSHTRFSKNWDQILINDLEDLKAQYGKKSILALSLTIHSNIYTKIDTRWKIVKDCPLILSHEVQANVFDEEIQKYVKTQRAAAGGLFLDRDSVIFVETDQHSQARNEVVYLSFCFLMNGYDIYTTTRMPISHDNLKYNEYISNLPKNRQPVNDSEQKTFISNFFSGYSEDESDMVEALIYNTGRFSIKSPSIDIDKFWDKIELSSEYLDIKEKHDKLLNK